MARKKREVGVILTDSIKNRRYPGSGLASNIFTTKEKSLWIPSRVIAINWQLGGGIPYGKILELYGTESSGKTLLALDFASVVHSLGGVVLYNDAEQAFDPHWSELNGLDLSRTEVLNDTMVEVVSDWLLDMAVTYRNRLTNNEPILFIGDSIAAWDCKDNINSSQVDSAAEMGNRAKAIYTMVRRRNEALYELGVTSIFINQIRSKLGASKWEDPDTTPGGRAMKFFASQRLGLYGGKMIKEKIDKVEQQVGRVVSVRVKKNKVAPPRHTLKGMEMIYNEDYGTVGFNKYSNLITVLEELGVLERKPRSPMYYFEGESIARGEKSLLTLLSKDPELRKTLIRRSKINTVSRTRRRIENMEYNAYPVTARKAKNIIEDDEDEEEDSDY